VWVEEVCHKWLRIGQLDYYYIVYLFLFGFSSFFLFFFFALSPAVWKLAPSLRRWPNQIKTIWNSKMYIYIYIYRKPQHVG